MTKKRSQILSDVWQLVKCNVNRCLVSQLSGWLTNGSVVLIGELGIVTLKKK